MMTLRARGRYGSAMDFDRLLMAFFGTDDLSALPSDQVLAGAERLRVELGLERDGGRRFALWCLLYMLGAAPDLDVTFEDEGDQRDGCDEAAAEEMVCAAVKGERATDLQTTFVEELKGLLEQHEYVWRGVYDDRRFDRHVRAYLRKLIKMARANEGFGNTARYR